MKTSTLIIFNIFTLPFILGSGYKHHLQLKTDAEKIKEYKSKIIYQQKEKRNIIIEKYTKEYGKPPTVNQIFLREARNELEKREITKLQKTDRSIG